MRDVRKNPTSKLCLATRVEGDWDSAHVCTKFYFHVGPHVCGHDDHWTAGYYGDDEYDETHCEVRWDSTPEQMRAGAWTVDNAEAGDLVADRDWPDGRWLEVKVVLDDHLVFTDPGGREIVQRKRDFDLIYLLPQARDGRKGR